MQDFLAEQTRNKDPRRPRLLKVNAGMPDYRKKVSRASAFLPTVTCVNPASALRHQGQSGTAGHGIVPVLPDPCKPSLPLLAKTTATWGTFHGHQIFVVTATITAIFLASFPATFIAFPHRYCCCWSFCCWDCAFSCWCLAAGVPVAAGILAVANIPAVACFPAVAGVSYVGV